MKKFVLTTAYAVLFVTAVCQTATTLHATETPANTSPVRPVVGAAPDTSLVYVMATAQRPKFTQPWEKSQPTRKRGLGVVLAGNRILVTAELTVDATFIEFERPSNGVKATARVVAKDYECNLALLEPSSAEGSFLSEMTPLELDGPAKTGDRLTAWQLEDDGSPITTTGTLARVEIGHYFLPDRAFLRYEFKGSLQQKSGSFIIPAIRDGKLTGILLGYNADDQLADILPAPIIRRFLEDLADGQYAGSATLGVRITHTTDNQLRRWLQLPNEAGGVFITKIEQNSSAESAGIQSGDVILALDGFPLDRRGYYNDPDFGSINFGHIISGRKNVGDTITASIWRNHAAIELPVTLKRRAPESYLVEPWVFDRAPRYLVIGGLLFTELSRPYLQSFKDWEKNAPVELRYAEANQEEFSKGREKLVILAYMIPTPVTIGYEKIASRIVEEANGKPIGSMRDLHEALMRPIDGRHAIRVKGEDPILYLDAAQAELVDQQLQANGISPLTRLE